MHALVEGLRVERLPSDAPSVGPLTLLDRGDIIGRYVVLTHLGHGGMGVVYAAYDPELDRKIALKLLLSQRAGGLDDMGRARLLREAQALARLTHPNVVAVYDIGMHDDRVWIAMEFVAGKTLGEWAREKHRRWPEILRVLTDVARGIVAAHAAGLVHRDLKPENVMIDEKGRVRVMDFGLAHGRATVADHEFTSAPSSSGESQPETAALTLRLTRAGALNGTPAYMAPEQWQGQEATAAADQFGWSVMAWEMLFGERPFADDSLNDLASRVASGRMRPSPRGRRVPGWLRRMVERGLLPAPSQRWPTMLALLTKLERGRTRAWLKTATFLILVLTAMGAGTLAYRRWLDKQQLVACMASGANIAEVWNEEIQARLHAGLLATGAPYAGTTAVKMKMHIKAQVDKLRLARSEACIDARLRHVWDEEMLDRSVWCLDERRMELKALIEGFSEANAASIQHAAQAAADLSQVETCQDVKRLGRLPNLPTNRAGVQVVLQTISRSRALRAAGDYKSGNVEARKAVIEAEGLGWPPIVAAALLREGVLLELSGKYSEAEKIFERAYFTAASSGALEVAADAAISLSSTVGSQGRYSEGHRWSLHADVVLANLGGDGDSLRHADALHHHAGVYYDEGDYSTAKKLYQESLAIREKILGPVHPFVATSLNNLANVQSALGNSEVQKALHERALNIREETLGPDHPGVASSLNNLGTTYSRMGLPEEARPLYERAQAICEKSLGPEHPLLASIVTNLSIDYRQIGLYPKAKVLAERALSIYEGSMGREHPYVAVALITLADIHVSTNSYEEARVLFERALRIKEKNAPKHPNVAFTLNSLAEVALAQHRWVDAMTLATRAEAHLSNIKDAPAGDRAHSKFMLARALWSAPVGKGRDRDRALALARQARDSLIEAKDNGEELKDMESFLAEHEDQPKG